MVTNRKLYIYFQRWSSSEHTRAGVTCVDCHGGNSQSFDEEEAHGGELGASRVKSAVSFRNISGVCGRCHEVIYRRFRESAHFKHVASKDEENQGPTCVTCHGSVNVAVLNAYAVEETCRKCHNEETQNHPRNAREARELLRSFLSIRLQYSFIAVRGDPAATKPFLDDVDARLHDLTVTWHTFDLDAIREETGAALDQLRAKRQEVARAALEKDRQARGQAPR